MNMNLIIRAVSTVFFIFIALISCSINEVTLYEDQTNTPQSNDTGELLLSIPLIPTYLTDALNDLDRSVIPQMSAAGKAIAVGDSKATGFAQRVHIEITGPENRTFDLYPGTGSNNIMASQLLMEGSGYGVTVSVFNQTMSDTVWRTRGTASFEVELESITPVTVLCTPNSDIVQSIPAGPTPTEITGAVPSSIVMDLMQIATPGSEFWFLIDGSGFDSTTVTIDHDGVDGVTGFVCLSLFDSYGLHLQTVFSPGLASLTEGPLSLSFPSAGMQHYVCVMPLTNASAPDTEAQFYIDYTTGPSDDGFEPNNDIGYATPITSGTPVDAISMNADYYRFDLTELSNVTLQCTAADPNAKMSMTLYDYSIYYIKGVDDFKGNDGVINERLQPGIYYILIPASDIYAIEYQLILNTSSLPTDDVYDDGNGNDEITFATAINQGDVLDAICNDDDYYTFTLATPATVTINCTFLQANGDIDIYLRDDWGIMLEESESTSDNEIIQSVSLNANVPYYIQVKPFDAAGTPYQISWIFD